jgi:RimJ/RimL family protein N-acetyltransferase
VNLRPDYPVVTARLWLRPLETADTDDLVAYRSLNDVCRYVPFEPMTTEAAHAVLHLAFDQLGLHRVIARVDARNDASLRLADRLGMRREAHLVSNEWFKGAWSDEVDLALLEDEWVQQLAGGSWPIGPGSRAAPHR